LSCSVVSDALLSNKVLINDSCFSSYMKATPYSHNLFHPIASPEDGAPYATCKCTLPSVKLEILLPLKEASCTLTLLISTAVTKSESKDILVRVVFIPNSLPEPNDCPFEVVK